MKTNKIIKSITEENGQMLGSLDQHVQHLVGDILNLVTLHLMDKPLEDLFFIFQVTC
jgi:hypothetical protein